MKLIRQNLIGPVICGSLAASPFLFSLVRDGAKGFAEWRDGQMWGAPALSVVLWLVIFCAAIGTQLKLSWRETKSSLAGALIGLAPFALWWISVGTRSFIHGELGKAPPVAIAFIVALCGAVIGATLRKK